jgi:hypothetical protein
MDRTFEAALEQYKKTNGGDLSIEEQQALANNFYYRPVFTAADVMLMHTAVFNLITFYDSTGRKTSPTYKKCIEVLEKLEDMDTHMSLNFSNDIPTQKEDDDLPF